MWWFPQVEGQAPKVKTMATALPQAAPTSILTGHCPMDIAPASLGSSRRPSHSTPAGAFARLAHLHLVAGHLDDLPSVVDAVTVCFPEGGVADKAVERFALEGPLVPAIVAHEHGEGIETALAG